jgi:hypothetical protein
MPLTGLPAAAFFNIDVYGIDKHTFYAILFSYLFVFHTCFIVIQLERMMNKESGIQKLKKKAYLDFHKDGILDIFLGASILGLGTMVALDNVVFGFVPMLSFSLYPSLKNAVTVPRFGYVSFQEGKRQTGLAIGLGIFLFILILFIGILYALGPGQLQLPPIAFLRKYHVHVMSAIGAVLIIIFGFTSGINRFKIYGLIFMAAVLVSFLFEFRGDLTMLAMGGLILIIGLIMMVSFIQGNPIQAGVDTNAR